MYRVMFWIGTLKGTCDMRLLAPGHANALKRDYEERGYSAAIVSGHGSCLAAELGTLKLHATVQ